MKKRLLSFAIVLLVLIIAVGSCVSCFVIYPQFTTNKNNDIDNPDGREPIDYTDTFYLIDALFKNFSMFDVDYETAMLSAIRAYVGATGDRYAMYYTPDEFKEMTAENNGDLYGIGVQVIFDYDGYFMEIVLIMPDSPAQTQLQIGDKVTHIIDDGNKVALADIVEQNKQKVKELYPSYTEEEINNAACYETFQYAVSKLKGAEGTHAEFTILRGEEELEMKVQRAKVKTVSVTAKTSIRDAKVGIVSISQFDLTTPTQFKECMDSLIESGCDKFVFDLRNNPGGDLASVVAVLSTLLNEGDVVLSTKDSSGDTEITKVKPLNYSLSSGYSSCSVSKSDIGKYRGYKMAVLVDGNSASAAELFTSALRDHELAQIVGVKTYGKGSMQSIIDLSYYNEIGKDPIYFGALKLTTKLYFPPCGTGYDGLGINPNHTVELEGIAAETHFYKLTEDIDNQLQKAVSILID